MIGFFHIKVVPAKSDNDVYILLAISAGLLLATLDAFLLFRARQETLKAAGKRILFDTGQGTALKENARSLGIDLSAAGGQEELPADL